MLTEKEHKVFLELAKHPRLWPFMQVVGAVGLEGALEVCRTRAIPPAVLDVFTRLAYSPEQLISAVDAEELVLGVRIIVGRQKKETFQAIGARLKIKPPLALRAISRTLDLYCTDEGQWSRLLTSSLT